jgi:hypothetical protein
MILFSEYVFNVSIRQPGVKDNWIEVGVVGPDDGARLLVNMRLSKIASIVKRLEYTGELQASF